MFFKYPRASIQEKPMIMPQMLLVTNAVAARMVTDRQTHKTSTATLVAHPRRITHTAVLARNNAMHSATYYIVQGTKLTVTEGVAIADGSQEMITWSLRASSLEINAQMSPSLTLGSVYLNLCQQ